MIDITIKGEKTVRRAIGRQRREIIKAAKYGAANWMSMTMRTAQRLAPKDTGALKASAYARFLLRDGTGQMGFAVWYASRVEYDHPSRFYFFHQAVLHHRKEIAGIIKKQRLQKRVSRRRYGIPESVDVGLINGLRPGAIR